MSGGRPSHQIFAFTHATFESRTLRLGYAFRGGPDPDIDFEEQLRLPDAVPAPDPADPVVARLVDGCHRTFGVSYFKAAIPPRIEAAPVDDADADWWDALYSVGLGEFYFRNGLDPRGRAQFPRRAGTSAPPPHEVTDATRAEHALVLVGGGKDSAVAAEIVRHAGVRATALSLGDSPWMRASASAAGLDHLTIGRRLDPRLFDLNARGAWNGHVPISACIAMVSTLVAHVGGFTDVIVGNEHGADEANVEWEGIRINHQWSKSLEFERGFRAWVARQTAGAPRYFSLLRPMGEVAIAAAFARHPNHFEHFTSCNRNFRQPGRTAADRWCGQCPKCVFVQLCLAPHLTAADVARIFPRDFLADPENVPILEALLGVRGVKPWECVGTPPETRLSLTLLHQQRRLRGAAAEWLTAHPNVLVGDPDAALRAALAPSGPHCLSPRWDDRLHAYLGSAGR